MDLIYPFKNLTIYYLNVFFKVELAKKFSDLLSYNEDIYKSTINYDIESYQNSLPNFENEILQIIETTNQPNIDIYFECIVEDIQKFKYLLEKSTFFSQLKEWNNIELNIYNELVERKTKEYFENEDRIKYRHLEQYDGYEIINPLRSLFSEVSTSNMRKIKITNYNFYCVNEKPNIIIEKYFEDYYEFVAGLSNQFIHTAEKYSLLWQKGQIKASSHGGVILRPIIFCEGEHDISFIKKAAFHLGKEEIISRVDLRQRGGCDNLDKLWSILTHDNWETVPQIKILLYDCDVKQKDEDFGHVHKRIIPLFENHIVKRGIENLFPTTLVERAIQFKKEFVDLRKTEGRKRGVDYSEDNTVINKDEKKSFCEWVCNNGSPKDFEYFHIIFNILDNIFNESLQKES